MPPINILIVGNEKIDIKISSISINDLFFNFDFEFRKYISIRACKSLRLFFLFPNNNKYFRFQIRVLLVFLQNILSKIDLKTDEFTQFYAFVRFSYKSLGGVTNL